MSDTVLTYLADQFRHHGLSFVLLGVAVWYFQGQNLKMAAEIKACNESLIELYRTDRIRNIEVINNNTRALESLKSVHRND